MSAPETEATPVATVAEAAAGAASAISSASRAERGEWLHGIARALEASAEQVVATCVRETHLSEERLRGELERTSGQLRFYAEAALEGSYLGATVEREVQGFVGDLRRVNVPLGPVAVFTAGNFPLAFGVLGTDTASALAAGCPVVVKGHPGHPATTRALFALGVEAMQQAGAPSGALQLVQGMEEGIRLVEHPAIKAVAFTGSFQGGRALEERVRARPQPVPFFGELGSLNPVFVTEQAAMTRAADIVDGFVKSFTGSGGQLCTKPGVLLVPAGAGFPDMLERALAPLADIALLNEPTTIRFKQRLERLSDSDRVRRVGGTRDAVDALAMTPVLLSLDSAAFREELPLFAEECFGPAALVVEYASESELIDIARRLPGQLTATVHAEDAEVDRVADLVAVLTTLAGRLIWNGWPTGVPVAWATHHGGPYPAATVPWATSVGAHALERFVRPVAFQNLPPALVPGSDAPGQVFSPVPTRVDGIVDK